MNWKVYTWDPVSRTFVNPVPIPTPGAAFSVTTRVPHEVHTTINGDKKIIFLPTPTVYNTISWSISMLSATPQLISFIETLIKNRTKVKLETHTGEAFEGYFLSLVKTYEMTGSNQLWTLEIEFFIEKKS